MFTWSALYAISSLGLQHSAAHADDRSLAARTDAAELARRLNRHRDDGKKEIKILGAFAHGLAEAGRFERAVTAQREVVDIHNATEGPTGNPSPDGVVWSLLDLAIYLDSGRTGRCEPGDRTRGHPDQTPHGRSRTTVSARTDDLARGGLVPVHRRRASSGSRRTPEEAVATCSHRPPEGDRGNFGFHQAVHAALFARSGARDERSVDGRTIPIGVSQVSSPTLKPFMELLGESLPVDAVDDGPGRLVAPVLRVRDILVPRRHVFWMQRSTAQIHLSDFFQP